MHLTYIRRRVFLCSSVADKGACAALYGSVFFSGSVVAKEVCAAFYLTVSYDATDGGELLAVTEPKRCLRCCLLRWRLFLLSLLPLLLLLVLRLSSSAMLFPSVGVATLPYNG